MSYPTTSSDVAAEEISNSPSRPASLTIFFIMYSAIGLLQMFPRHTKSIFCILLIVFLPCGWFLRCRLAGVFCQELFRFCLADVLFCQELFRFCLSGRCSLLSKAAPLLSVWRVFSTALRSCYPSDEGDQKAFCSPSSGLPNPRRLTSAIPIRGISRPGAVP